MPFLRRPPTRADAAAIAKAEAAAAAPWRCPESDAAAGVAEGFQHRSASNSFASAGEGGSPPGGAGSEAMRMAAASAEPMSAASGPSYGSQGDWPGAGPTGSLGRVGNPPSSSRNSMARRKVGVETGGTGGGSLQRTAAAERGCVWEDGGFKLGDEKRMEAAFVAQWRPRRGLLASALLVAVRREANVSQRSTVEFLYRILPEHRVHCRCDFAPRVCLARALLEPPL